MIGHADAAHHQLLKLAHHLVDPGRLGKIFDNDAHKSNAFFFHVLFAAPSAQ